MICQASAKVFDIGDHGQRAGDKSAATREGRTERTTGEAEEVSAAIVQVEAPQEHDETAHEVGEGKRLPCGVRG
jgi:hypothetical protein